MKAILTAVLDGNRARVRQLLKANRSLAVQRVENAMFYAAGVRHASLGGEASVPWTLHFSTVSRITHTLFVSGDSSGMAFQPRPTRS